MTEAFGQQAIVSILIHLVFIFITWWALQTVRIDVFLRKPDSPQAKVFMIFITIAIGSLVGNFFLDYYNWSLRLKYLF
ncbi:DUF1146 family protein [Pseudalkalibacillus caeni]|uniref:DUF1146 domain-containing protein n=1 Tax=Exobacillus caeni TaxID=2574798 RepID=A0A5R9EXK2_9BACL|nr:DUF1146 family protein [Pseudalkalibacillus caeni]TLS35817.1 DUF1146 domain-containing protein [Pseudalkalibacillus caeni]